MVNTMFAMRLEISCRMRMWIANPKASTVTPACTVWSTSVFTMSEVRSPASAPSEFAKRAS